MAKKLIIDWKEYNLIVEKLAIQIHDSGYKPNILIGIMRGGAPIIDVLSRVFKLKCAYLAVESYFGDNIEDQQGDLIFSFKGGYLFNQSILLFNVTPVSDRSSHNRIFPSIS